MSSSHDDLSIARTLIAALSAMLPEREALESEVITYFRPMSHALARRYRDRGVEADDLEQVADLALLKAMRRYDPDVGHLRGYLAATVLGEIKKYFRDHGWVIRPPRHIQDLQSTVLNAVTQGGDSSIAQPRTVQVANALGIDRAVVAEVLLARGGFRCLTLDRTMGDSDIRLLDGLTDGEDPYEGSDRRMFLLAVCASLSDHERDLLRLRFVEELSQHQIAVRLESTQKQVSRALQRILSKLRQEAFAEAV
jgi:RNA polymerase sigma-B factor